jgi:hypothetical protein
MIAAGLFDLRFRRCEDFDLWVRMSARGATWTYHRAVLAWHRLRPGSAAADRAAMFESQARVYEKLGALLGPNHPSSAKVARALARSRADHALELAKQHLAGGRYHDAVCDLDRAYAFYGTAKLSLARLGLRAAPAVMRRLYFGGQTTA